MRESAYEGAFPQGSSSGNNIFRCRRCRRRPVLPIDGAEDLQLPRRDPKPLRTMNHSLLYNIITDMEESY